MSLDLDAMRKMKSLRPGWKVGRLMSMSAGILGVTPDIGELQSASIACRRG